MPNSRGREHETQLSFSFRELWYSRLEFKSKKIANIWRIIRDGISRRLRKSSIVGTEVPGFLKWHFISSVEVEYMDLFLSPFNLNLKLSFPMRSYEAGFASWHS